MLETMDNGVVDVLILYGDIPGTIYPPGNALPDGSVAEGWLETPDGDTILNHADWIFWGREEREKQRERVTKHHGYSGHYDVGGQYPHESYS